MAIYTHKLSPRLIKHNKITEGWVGVFFGVLIYYIIYSVFEDAIYQPVYLPCILMA